MLFPILISSFIVSLISLIGVFFISKKLEKENYYLFVLVAFAAGAMLGNAFFHLLPEALEELEPITFSIIFLSGFVSFFIIERIVHWRHCHEGSCHDHYHKPVGFLNLIGDAFHNLLDGILIAVSYLAGFEVGVATTLAIMAHEIPQEIGDFSVLVYSGFSKSKALLFNFLSALFALVGALIGFFVFDGFDNLIPFVLPVVAGTLVYISTTDLVPELHKENKFGKSLVLLLSLILGIVLLYVLKILFE